MEWPLQHPQKKTPPRSLLYCRASLHCFCTFKVHHIKVWKNAEISLKDLSVVFPIQFCTTKMIQMLAVSILISPFLAQKSAHCVRIYLEGDTNNVEAFDWMVKAFWFIATKTQTRNVTRNARLTAEYIHIFFPPLWLLLVSDVFSNYMVPL